MLLRPALFVCLTAACAGGPTISFEPPRWFGLSSPEPAGSGCIAAGDFNGDGRMDVASASADALAIMISNGDGTLQVPVRVPLQPPVHTGASARASCLTASDLNRDGRVDLVVSTGGATLLVLFGKGVLSFRQPVELRAPVHMDLVRAADFNGDGTLDLIAATTYTPGVPVPPREPSGVVVFLGAADCTFALPHVVASVPLAATFAIGDLNNDGRHDLAATAGYEPRISVWRGQGDGTFSEPSHHDAFGIVHAIGDLNGDGNADVLSSSPGAILVLPGNGDGTFRDLIRSSVNSFVPAVTVADVDRDGKLDALISSSDSVSVLLGNGDGAFAAAQSVGPRSGLARTGQIELLDLSGDGIVDIASSDEEGISVYIGNGSGVFREGPRYGAGKRLLRLLSGDWNGDGRTDLAAIASNGTVWFFAGDGSGEFRVIEEITVQSTSVLAIVAADFTLDGKTDLLVNRHWEDSLRPNDLELFVSAGDFRFAAPLRFKSRERPWGGIWTGDMNGDRKPDLIVSPNGLYISVLPGNGDGTFSEPIRTPVFFSLLSGIADLNSDGLPDLLDRDFASNARVLFAQGDGTFANPVIIQGVSFYSGVEAIDVDGDGTDDLLTAGGVFRGDGRGGFESLSDTSLLSFCENQSAGDDYCDVDVADFNDDRLSDLLSFPRIWTGVGSGAFVHAATIPSPNGSSWATHLIVDVNADGKPDIVAGDGTHRFAVFLNGSGRSSPNYQLK